jgi:hypothetical protein
MSYKITLEVHVNAEATFPTIKVESGPQFHGGTDRRYYDKPADTEALERDLTATRKFAETLTRGVLEES